MPGLSKAVLALTIAALLTPTTLVRADETITRTQYIYSKGSKEVIKVMTIDKVFARNDDPNKEIFVIQVCDAQKRDQCQPIIPGKERFTASELQAAIDQKTKTTQTISLITPLIMLGATLVKGSAAAGLSSLLGVAVSPWVIVGIAALGVAYGTYHSIKSTVQQSELQAVQETAFDSDTHDTKVFSVSMTEKALKDVLKKTSASQTSVN